MIDLHAVMAQLARERPVFHSEADFQHALAWSIHAALPAHEIRLERPVPSDDGPIRVDIWLEVGTSGVAIELKYKSKALELEMKGERFDLKDQSAQDLGRYDVLKDIERLEEVVRQSADRVGYAIMLTNDHLYWQEPRRHDTVDAAFRIHDGGTLGPGRLSWAAGTAEGTMGNKASPLDIRGAYGLRWRPYSDLRELDSVTAASGEFRYLAVELRS